MSPQHAIAERIFTRRVWLQALRQPTGTPAILFNDLVNLVRAPERVDAQALLQHINASVSLRRQYQQCVAQLAMSVSPVQAAASTQSGFPMRDTVHFSLRFKTDTQVATQHYAVLTVHTPTPHHLERGVRVQVQTPDALLALTFPPLSGTVTQLLFEHDDPALAALCSPEAAIYLLP